MEKIEGYKKLDEVLNFIVNSPSTVIFVDIIKKVHFTDLKELGEILNKLERDGYIRITETYQSMVGAPVCKYISTYEGRHFDGYVEQNEKNENNPKSKKIDKKNKTLNPILKDKPHPLEEISWIAAIIGVIVAILLGVWQVFYPDLFIKRIPPKQSIISPVSTIDPATKQSPKTDPIGLVKRYIKTESDDKKSPSKAIDTVKKTQPAVQYNINAPLDHSSVGNGATTNNYLDGFKQRHVTSDRLKFVLNKLNQMMIQNPALNKTDVVIWTMPQGEAEHFGLELKDKLVEKGFRVIFRTNLTGAKPDIKDFDMLEADDKKIGIIIQPPTLSELDNPDDDK